MLKKFLKAAMVAAAVCAISVGAQAADNLYVYGGGGGGGAGASDAGGTGKGGAAGTGYSGNSNAQTGTGGYGGLGDASGAGGAGGQSGGGGAVSGAPLTVDPADDTVVSAATGASAAAMTGTAGVADSEKPKKYTDIQIKGGVGGGGGNPEDAPGVAAGDGGDGGSATVNVLGDIEVANLDIIAGANGADVSAGSDADGTSGGKGGDATLNAANMRVILADIAAVVTSGADDGIAKLDVGTLAAAKGVAAKITFSSNTTGTLDVDIARLEAIDANLHIDVTAAKGAAEEVKLGTIAIGDGSGTGRTFTLTNTSDGGTYTWNQQMEVKGLGNTLTVTATSYALDATGDEALLTFDMTGVDAAGTMLTSTADFVIDEDTQIDAINLSADQLGLAITLIDGGADLLAADFVVDAAKMSNISQSVTVDGKPITNLATMTSAITADDSDGKVYLTAYGFEAQKDWIQESNLTILGAAGVNTSYKVPGTLSLGSKVTTFGFDGDGESLVADIGTLSVAGNTTVTFTDTKSLDDPAGDELNSARIGNIELMDRANLTMTGAFSKGEANPGLFSWTGGLITHNKVTLAGSILDLTGRNITSNIDENFVLGSVDADGIVTAGDTAISGNVVVDEKTKVTVKADNSHEAALRAGNAQVGIFNSTDNTFDPTHADFVDLNDQVEVVTDAYVSTGTMVNGVLTNIQTSLLDDVVQEAYAAALSAPAVMTLVNGGGDMAESAAGGFTPMAIQAGTIGGMQFGAFAGFGGGSVEVETGSSVDSDNFNLLVGPGLRINNGSGRIDIGAFFEAGWGNYDAFEGLARGEGNSEYYGGGILARYESCTGLYGELSARFGTTDVDYTSSTNAIHNYKFDSNYGGGHLGFGYINRFNDRMSLDMFAKGFLSVLQGSQQADAQGTRLLDVDRSTSLRTQIGAKFAYNFSNASSVYVKGAWEHEFDGETQVSYDGNKLKSSDMGGSSLIGAIGFDVRFAECATFGASVFGVTGRRDGFGGNINIAVGF